MGIKGLTSLVKRVRILLEEELCGGHLVIDGDNLLFFMRRVWVNDFAPRLGCDYAAFARLMERFFNDLQRCDVKPVVLMEMYDNIVNDKTLEELTESLSAHSVGDGLPPLPVLLDTMFVQVLRRLGVDVLRYDGDSDQAVAAVARRLHCPVLTGDSDLWLLGVPCVRLEGGNLLHRRPCIQRRSGARDRTYLKALVFRPERFEARFGIQRDMWSLLAVLAGNGYFPADVCDAFVRSLMVGLDPDNWVHRIQAIVTWLGHQRSAEQALRKALASIPGESHEKVEEFIRKHTGWREGMPLACVEDTSPQLHEQLQTEPAAETDAGDRSGWRPPTTRLLVARSLVMSTLLNSVRDGQLSWLLLRPSVEHPTLPATAQAAAPLLVLLSQLLGAPPGPRLLCLRHGRRLQLQAAWSPWKAPLLESVLLQQPEQRRRLLLSMVQLRAEAAAQLPEPLLLLAAALVHWRRTTGPRSSRRHLLAALLGWLSVAPPEAAAEALGDGAAAVQRRLADLQPVRPEQLLDLAEVHLLYELQYAYLAVFNINTVLDEPWPSADVDHQMNGPATLRMARKLGGPGEAAAAAADDNDLVTAAELDRQLRTLLCDEALEDALKEVADIIEAEARREGGPAAGTAAWRPLDDATREALHPDLRAARQLLSALNRATRERHVSLRDIRVTTEFGLYTLAALVCQRALSAPSQIGLCVWACLQLAELRVPMKQRRTTVSFKEMLPCIVISKLREFRHDVAVLDWKQVIEREEAGLAEDPVLQPLMAGNGLDLATVAMQAEEASSYPGLARFMSQLYRAKLLSHRVVLKCMLLMSAAGDDVSLRWLCQAMRVCGPLMPPRCAVGEFEDIPQFRKPKTTVVPELLVRRPELERPTPHRREPVVRVNQTSLSRLRHVPSEGDPDAQTLNDLLEKVETLSEDRSRSSLVRFQLKNVLWLRDRGWQRRSRS